MSNRKKTVMKRVLVVLSMLLLSTGSALAEDTSEKNGFYAEFTERDNELINQSLNYLGYDSAGRVYRTAFMEVEGQDNVVSLLYDDEQLIGEYVKLETEDGTYESFIIDNCDTLYELFTEEKPMVNGTIVNLPASEAIEIQDVEIVETASTAAIQPGDYELIDHAPANYLVGTASQGEIVLISNVSNDVSPDTGLGICWAAGGASVINYYKGSGISALYVYNYVKSKLGATPYGTIADIKNMFGFFNIGYLSRSGKLSYSELLACLSKGSPVYSMISRYDAGGNRFGHVVVLCGAFRISTSYGYIFMDPNVNSKYVLNYMDYSVISNTSTTFSYNNGTRLYTKWENTIYNFANK